MKWRRPDKKVRSASIWEWARARLRQKPRRNLAQLQRVARIALLLWTKRLAPDLMSVDHHRLYAQPREFARREER
jgi:hypothetical protein